MGLKGYRLWAMGQLDSTCSAPPRIQSLRAGFGERRQIIIYCAWIDKVDDSKPLIVTLMISTSCQSIILRRLVSPHDGSHHPLP
jgi:hypothetical protein